MSTADGTQLASWFEEVKGEVPLALTGPSITLSPLPSPYPPTVFLYGGKIVPTRRMSDQMWALDLNQRKWSRVTSAGTGPGVRYFHSMDVWEDKLVLFGGMSEQEVNGPSFVHDDVWFFDCRQRRWLPQPSPTAGPSLEPIADELTPSARYAHLSAISRDHLVVCGGQRHDNSWIYEISAYDLRRHVWVSKTPQPESHGLHSKGAYRSVAISTNQRVVLPLSDSHTFTGTQALPYSVDEEGYGGNIYCYSNYDFAKVRRELEILRPLDGADPQPVTSDKFTSIPGYTVRDVSNKMSGVSQPPGLRFPSGGIVGHHFVLTGLYLASTSAAFSIWTLDLTTMVWRHIEPTVLKSGSWNRSVLCPDSARLLVFGDAESDLATDYGKRAVNLNHVAVVELEAYGIYRPPKQVLQEKTQNMGLTLLDQTLLCDFEVVASDGRRVKCSRRVLAERWPWFAEQQAAIVSRAGEIVHEVTSLDIHDALVSSLSPARMTPNRLHMPEEFPVCVALVQYFYTLSLSTQLQNRGQVLTSLLFIAKQYRIDRLRKLVLHALHSRLEPKVAANIYEVACLAGEHPLQARALLTLHHARHSKSSSHHNHPRGPGSVTAHDGTNDAAPNAEPHSTLYPMQNSSTGGNTTAPPSNGGGAGDEQGHFRRARADSLLVPADVMDLEPVPPAYTAAETLSSLFDGLDLSAAPPTPPESPKLLRSVSPAPTPSTFGRSSGRLKRVPPMLPPPARPLPIVPHEALLTPVTSLTDDTLRASSPTNSEATSNLRTPSSSTRGSTYMVRDESPYSPSVERRSSLSGSLRSKTNTLPSLPEDNISIEMSEDETRTSTEACDGEEHVQTPCVVIDPSWSAPQMHPSLNLQQEHAMKRLTANSMAMTPTNLKLTRAASLTSLGAPRPRSAIAGYGLGGSPKVSSSMNVLPEMAADFGPTETDTAERAKTWSKNKHGSTTTLAGYTTTNARGKRASTSTTSSSLLEPPSMDMHTRAGRRMTMSKEDEVERERLAQIHAFIAEQQRQAGITQGEAIERARRATGRAGGKNRFGAFRAKVADVLLNT